MSTDRIPLFPLEVVLFPGTPLPLHIFEPRYKEMIRMCLEQRRDFGVVLAREKAIASVGCTAKIQRVVRTYPDGRMDILTTGQTVFVIRHVAEEKSYQEADVEFLPADDLDVPPVGQEVLVELFQECCVTLTGNAPEVPHFDAETGSGPLLAFALAAELPLELEFKQELLETPSEFARQKNLLAHLREWLPQLQRQQRLRKKAGGNGHGEM